MRSHEAVSVPVTSTRWRPGARHHVLAPGSAGHAGPAMGAPRGDSPAMAGHHCLTRRGRRCASRQSVPSPRLGRYGVSPSSSGYLASEHAI
jgi:hypothetical protein